ncbi:hypothetical protein ZWY2020_021903 [Hordeum vulgare]|nr:hypothetical protein ZWY2020_021903 [Hordeum vulgare]
MWIASRQRFCLTLASGWSPAAPTWTDSRFSCLQTEEAVGASKVEEGSAAVRQRKTDEELDDEFWVDTGFPTPTSRMWERPLTRLTGEVFHACRCVVHGDLNSSEDAANSIGPEVPPSMPAMERGVVGVPTRFRALGKPWIGPLPPPRVSPPRRLRDLLPHARRGVESSLPPSISPAVTPVASSSNAFQTPDPVITEGPVSLQGSTNPERPLRMVDLNRWLRHLWNRKAHEANPNFTRSLAAVVRSPAMTRGDPAAPLVSSVATMAGLLWRCSAARSFSVWWSSRIRSPGLSTDAADAGTCTADIPIAATTTGGFSADCATSAGLPGVISAADHRKSTTSIFSSAFGWLCTASIAANSVSLSGC